MKLLPSGMLVVERRAVMTAVGASSTLSGRRCRGQLERVVADRCCQRCAWQASSRPGSRALPYWLEAAHTDIFVARMWQLVHEGRTRGAAANIAAPELDLRFIVGQAVTPAGDALRPGMCRVARSPSKADLDLAGLAVGQGSRFPRCHADPSRALVTCVMPSSVGSMTTTLVC